MDFTKLRNPRLRKDLQDIFESTMTVGKAAKTLTCGLEFVGTYSNHILDFSKVAVSSGAELIRAGSYAAPIAVGTGNGLIYMYAETNAESGAYAGTFLFVRTTKAAAAIAESALAEGFSTVNYPSGLQGGQFMAGLREGAGLAALIGATDGMYGIWAKVYALTTSVVQAGSRVAALWVDNQMSCVCSGEEYGIFATTGGSKPDAFVGFETTSSGWAQLFYFDETAYNKEPVVSTGCNITGDAQSVPYLKVLVNATQYGIPLIAI